jgi:hypothetical protein
LLWFGDFVADDAADCSAGTGAQNAAAQNITGNTPNDGTSGGAFLLLRHAGTASQAQSRQQQDGRQNGGNAIKLVHEKFLQFKINKAWSATRAVTGELELLTLLSGHSVRLRTQEQINLIWPAAIVGFMLPTAQSTRGIATSISHVR